MTALTEICHKPVTKNVPFTFHAVDTTSFEMRLQAAPKPVEVTANDVVYAGWNECRRMVHLLTDVKYAAVRPLRDWLTWALQTAGAIPDFDRLNAAPGPISDPQMRFFRIAIPHRPEMVGSLVSALLAGHGQAKAFAHAGDSRIR